MDRIKRIGIYIPTYRRPLLLRKCIISVIESIEKIRDKYQCEIIIVDNDIDKCAEEVVIDIRKNFYSDIKYINEKQKGYSSVRNRCISDCNNKKFDYIAFIDDDETASRQWLYELTTCIEACNGHIVIGPVDGKYSIEAPEWMKKVRFHSKNLNLENKSIISPKLCRTDNVLILTSVINDTRFDMNFNTLGSEDYKFFIDLHKKNNLTIVWASNAFTSEEVPINRTKLKYLLKRTYKIGLARSILDKQDYNNGFKSYFVIILKSVYNCFGGLMKIIKSLASGRESLYRGFCQISGCLGRLRGLFNKYKFDRRNMNESNKV